MLRNHIVDLGFYCGDLLRSRLRVKDVVTFGLLLFHMGIPRTRASEHLHHRGIEDMLGSMSRFKLLFVMCIQYWLIHFL